MSKQRRLPVSLGWSIAALAVSQAVFWLGWGVYHKAVMTDVGLVASFVSLVLVVEHFIHRD